MDRATYPVQNPAGIIEHVDKVAAARPRLMRGATQEYVIGELQSRIASLSAELVQERGWRAGKSDREAYLAKQEAAGHGEYQLSSVFLRDGMRGACDEGASRTRGGL